MNVPSFQIENDYRMGATAMMLSELKEVLKIHKLNIVVLRQFLLPNQFLSS
jgi:hypothetical protein